MSIRRRVALSGLVLSVLVWATVSGASASGTQRIEVRDDCDPATFNQAVGPGTCIGSGNTTFQTFIAELTKTRKVGAWRNNPDVVGIHAGTPLEVVNRGGETHSFTCVTSFGGGVVDVLNQLSGNLTPAVPCAGEDPHFLPAGATLSTPISLSPGTHQFQCLIHPWMRTVVTVKNAS